MNGNSKSQAWKERNAWWYVPVVLPMVLASRPIAAGLRSLAALVTKVRSPKAPTPPDPGAWMDSDAAMAEALRKDDLTKSDARPGDQP